MIKMKFISYSLIIIAVFIGCSDDNPVATSKIDDCAYAIYFLKDTTITIQEILNTEIKDLELADEPWMSQSDIEFYDWSSHCIYLKKNKSFFLGDPANNDLFYIRWNNRPFIVTAENRICYKGYFLPFLSSDIYPCPDILEADINLYSSDIIRIEWPYLFATDQRNNEYVKTALTNSNLLHEGLYITIDTLWIDNADTTTVEYKITINNRDEDNLYVMDPDKMGTKLFHAFTNGPIFYNSTNKTVYSSIYKNVTLPDPLDYYDYCWFAKIKSGESISRKIILTGYPPLPEGNYYCCFTFGSPYNIEKCDRTLSDGRYWIGSMFSEVGEFDRVLSKISNYKIRSLSRIQQKDFINILLRK